MGIINQEALAERQRKLYTVPTSMTAARFGGLTAGCRAALDPALYTLDTTDNLYKLVKLPSQLTDNEKYGILECLKVPNGIKSLQVSIVGNTAELEVRFFNRNSLAKILSDAAANPAGVKNIFPMTGGHRVLAGPATGQVQVTLISALPDPVTLKLKVTPIGDYSTYRLGVDIVGYPDFDPILSDIPFRFRPGCFNTNCAPEWKPGAERKPVPVIDYLAKDYDSFRQSAFAKPSCCRGPCL